MIRHCAARVDLNARVFRGTPKQLMRLSTAGVPTREGELTHGLWLDETGCAAAEIRILCDADGLLAVIEGPGDPDVSALTPTDARVVALEGPFSWQWLGQMDRPAAAVLPPRTGYRNPLGEACVSASRSGEYGYWMVSDRDDLDARLDAAVGDLDVSVATPAELSGHALEAFHFDPWTWTGMDPSELQLQRRLGTHDFHGRAAWTARARTHRLTCFRGQGADFGDDGSVVHQVGDIGIARLRRPVAHAGLELGGVRTVSAPFVIPRSAFVKRRAVSWAQQADVPAARST